MNTFNVKDYNIKYLDVLMLNAAHSCLDLAFIYCIYLCIYLMLFPRCHSTLDTRYACLNTDFHDLWQATCVELFHFA